MMSGTDSLSMLLEANLTLLSKIGRRTKSRPRHVMSLSVKERAVCQDTLTFPFFCSHMRLWYLRPASIHSNNKSGAYFYIYIYIYTFMSKIGEYKIMENVDKN